MFTFQITLVTLFHLFKNCFESQPKEFSKKPLPDIDPGSQCNDTIGFSDDPINLYDKDVDHTGSDNQLFCALSAIKRTRIVIVPNKLNQPTN